MSERPRACPGCLRRAWLIASLASYIDKAVDSTAGSRAHELLALPDEDLAKALAPSHAAELLQRAAERDPERLRAAVAGARAWACCRHDGLYPDSLGGLGDPPAVLFGRGNPELLARFSAEEMVTIVGSRRASSYGRELATDLGREVAAAGLTVVSGMAIGIDSQAHRGALDGGGLTVAVLGCGVDVPYPPRHARLYDEIVGKGVVIAELPPGTTARRWTFPARNRIMAALSRLTVVVEARERSGSLITAEMAQELSREVGAVPGRVGSSPAAGTNALLRDGASVIRGAEDVLDSMIGVGAEHRARPAPRGPMLEPDLAAVLDLVEGGSSSADALARASRLEPGSLAAALVRLELAGYLRSDSAGRYERTALAAPHPGVRPHGV
jgi:DNA processing protein